MYNTIYTSNGNGLKSTCGQEITDILIVLSTQTIDTMPFMYFENGTGEIFTIENIKESK